jgi:SpoVK/Ycf46/Vps4 family AAA+-type ATPase
MVWNASAWDHLVYDDQAKDLVLAFVENHNNAKPLMGDVIVGKGEGLIILLSGPPGTGKTLTAEAGKSILQIAQSSPRSPNVIM